MRISLDSLRPVGQGLSRPESVVALSQGQLYCSDAHGGVMAIAPDGQQRLQGTLPGLTPNGIAALPGGRFLAANVGHQGGLWHLSVQGEWAQVDIRLDGQPLPEVNFVHVDAMGRLWLCISSAGAPDPVFTPQAQEGFIVLGDDRGFRVVARGLGWTNELRVHLDSQRLFVNETFGRRLLEFRIAPDGSLHDRRVLIQFGVGDYPDGMALDAEGGIWVASIISNRLYRVLDGRCERVFSDCDPVLVERLEQLFTSRGLRRADLHGLRTGQRINHLSSIAFGGPDMTTLYLGSLGSDCLWSANASVAGLVTDIREPTAFLPLNSHDGAS